MKLFAIVAMLAFVLSVPAGAQERITALDLAVDWRSMIGAKVSVTGCTLVGANVDTIMCDINSKTGSAGSFWVDPLTMSRESLRRALSDCADFVPAQGCRVTLEGQVADSMGDLLLTEASATWLD